MSPSALPSKTVSSCCFASSSTRTVSLICIDGPTWSLQVQADVHPIMSKVFATGVSLRFPRVERARFDKSWRDAQTVQELLKLVRDQRSLIGEGPRTIRGSVMYFSVYFSRYIIVVL